MHVFLAWREKGRIDEVALTRKHWQEGCSAFSIFFTNHYIKFIGISKNFPFYESLFLVSLQMAI